MEEILIKQIENGIRAIRIGSKTPKDVQINVQIERLKKMNEGMALELNAKYVNVVRDYSNRK